MIKNLLDARFVLKTWHDFFVYFFGIKKVELIKYRKTKRFKILFAGL